MERVRLDYQRRDVPLPRAGLVLLSVAVVASLAVGGRFFDLAGKLAASEAATDRLETTAHRAGVTVNRDAEAERGRGDEIRYANGVLRQLTLPWDKLFATIEGAGGKDVALLSLAPDRDKQAVHIAIEAKNAAAGLDYLRVLEGEQIFDSVRVRSHQIQLQDPEKPIRFTFQAAWKDSP